jgi:hypothetical protein
MSEALVATSVFAVIPLLQEGLVPDCTLSLQDNLAMNTVTHLAISITIAPHLPHMVTCQRDWPAPVAGQIVTIEDTGPLSHWHS